MIHFGCAGYSPRTTTESQVIRFGSDVTRVEVDVAPPRRARHDRGRLPARGAQARHGRRGSRAVGRAACSPASRCSCSHPTASGWCRVRRRSGAPGSTARWCGSGRRWQRRRPPTPAPSSQRNHLLRRVRAGVASPDGLDAWDGVLAAAGAELLAARERLCSRIVPRLSARLAELGGDPGDEPLRLLANAGGPELLATLGSSRRRDIERGSTEPRPASRRRRAARGGLGHAPVRLAGRAAADAARADPGRGRPPGRGAGRAAAAPPGRRDRRVRRAAGAGCCSMRSAASTRRS